MARIALTANTTFYISTTGSDATGDGSVGNPWRTIQHGVDYICNSLDLVNFHAILQLAPGTYAENVIVRGYVSGALQTHVGFPTIKGDVANPSAYVIEGGSGIAIFGGSISYGWLVQGVKLQATSGGTCVESDDAIHILLDSVEFGNAGIHCMALYTGMIKFISNGYTISGGANVHLYSEAHGQIVAQPGHTNTLVGNPNFSLMFAACFNGSLINMRGQTYSGTATGKQYDVESGGVLMLAGTTLPGNVAGTNTGGFVS